MALIAALLATLAAGLFTGAAVYIIFVEHPARVSCGSALAVTEFGPSYTRASGSRCRADSPFPIIVSQPTDESGLHLGTYFATAAGSANGNPPTEVVEAAPLTACGVEEIVG